MASEAGCGQPSCRGTSGQVNHAYCRDCAPWCACGNRREECDGSRAGCVRRTPPAGLDTTATRAVLDDVLAERGRQNAKWGQQDLPNGTGQRGDREAARSAQKACAFAASHGGLTYRHIADEEIAEAFAETDDERLEVECIQAAAVFVQWVEAIRRRRARAKEATNAR